MSKSLFTAVGLALPLPTRCARYAGVQGIRTCVRPMSRVRASRSWTTSSIIVSQEPIYVQQDTDNTIYLVAAAGRCVFLPEHQSEPGDRFDNPQMPHTRCDLYNNDKWTYVCTYKKANRAKYPYTIRVTRNGTDILKSDPTVMNN